MSRFAGHIGIRTFGLSQISAAESAWYVSVDAGLIPFNERDETAFGHLYALWLLPCEELLKRVMQVETSGFRVDRASDFRMAVEEARSSACGAPLTAEMIQRVRTFQAQTSGQLQSIAEHHPPPAIWFDEPDVDLQH